MVGGIKARAFEDDLGGCDDALDGLLAAFGAGLEWGVMEPLLALELDTA